MDEERNFTIEPEDEPPAQSEYTQPDYIPEWTQPTQPEEPEEPKKKRRTWLKITALLLALAVCVAVLAALARGLEQVTDFLRELLDWGGLSADQRACSA